MGTLDAQTPAKRGLAGVIVDAAIRDKLEFWKLDFPCFSGQASTPRAPANLLPGRINHPSAPVAL